MLGALVSDRQMPAMLHRADEPVVTKHGIDRVAPSLFADATPKAAPAPVRPAVLCLPEPSGKPIKHMQNFFCACPRCDKPLRYMHHIHKSPVMHCDSCKWGWPIAYLNRKWSAVKASVSKSDAMLARSKAARQHAEKHAAAAAKLNQHIPSNGAIKLGAWKPSWVNGAAFAHQYDSLIDALVPAPANPIAAPVEMIKPQALIVHPAELNTDQFNQDSNMVVLPDEYTKLAKLVIDGAKHGAHHGTSIALFAGFRIDFTDGDLKVYLRRGKAGGKQLLIAEREHTAEPRHIKATEADIRAFAIGVGYIVPLAEIVEPLKPQVISRASNGVPPRKPLSATTYKAQRTGGL